MKTGIMSLPAVIGEILMVLLTAVFILILVYHGVVKVTKSRDYLQKQTQRLAVEAK